MRGAAGQDAKKYPRSRADDARHVRVLDAATENRYASGYGQCGGCAAVRRRRSAGAERQRDQRMGKLRGGQARRLADRERDHDRQAALRQHPHEKRISATSSWHLEWSAPTEIVGESQGRGNSGVFMQGMYEVQILDNYQNET